jgi:hypothetical protein
MRSGMNSRSAGAFGAAGLVLFATVLSSCRQPSPPPPGAAATPPAPPAATGTVPHGDHNPHHGGVVMMKGDLHYEVVGSAAGQWQLFFTDAVRDDLPASIASRVSFLVHRPGGDDEPIELHIDDTGESWIGSGRPVPDLAALTVRVAFTIDSEPYAIDVPMVSPKQP